MNDELSKLSRELTEAKDAYRRAKVAWQQEDLDIANSDSITSQRNANKMLRVQGLRLKSKRKFVVVDPPLQGYSLIQRREGVIFGIAVTRTLRRFRLV
jgi:hypothetical protein